MAKNYDLEEWPQDGKKWPTTKRREYIKYLGERIGLYNINKTELAKKMGISVSMIYKDFDAMYKAGLSRETLDHAKLHIKSNYDMIVRGLAQEFQKTRGGERARIADSLTKADAAYTDFLERFGIKAPEEMSGPKHTIHVTDMKRAREHIKKLLGE